MLGEKKHGVCNKHQIGDKLVWSLVLLTSLFWGKVLGKLLNLYELHFFWNRNQKKKNWSCFRNIVYDCIFQRQSQILSVFMICSPRNVFEKNEKLSIIPRLGMREGNIFPISYRKIRDRIFTKILISNTEFSFLVILWQSSQYWWTFWKDGYC